MWAVCVPGACVAVAGCGPAVGTVGGIIPRSYICVECFALSLSLDLSVFPYSESYAFRYRIVLALWSDYLVVFVRPAPSPLTPFHAALVGLYLEQCNAFL